MACAQNVARDCLLVYFHAQGDAIKGSDNDGNNRSPWELSFRATYYSLLLIFILDAS